MGVVYAVIDSQSGELLAAKTFRPEVFAANPGIAEQFLQEAYTWVNLDRHDNIVSARRVEIVDGLPFLLMDYIKGGNLRYWMDHHAGSDLEPRIQFGLQICDGMSHAYRRGVWAHRDLKPENCLIEGGQTLKITDFGLSASLSGNFEVRPRAGVREMGSQIRLSKIGNVAGTCTHMAPEQFCGAPANRLCDVYSFGIILYELITNTMPFVVSGLSEVEIWKNYRHAHLNVPPPRLAGHLGHFDEVIQTCLAKDPANRYQNFGDLWSVLSKIYAQLTGREPPIINESKYVDYSTWNSKGINLGHLGKLDEALQCFDRSIELKGDEPLVWSNKALTLAKSGRPEDALTCCERALELDPELLMALTLKSEILLNLGKPDAALAVSDRVLQIDPGSSVAWSSRGRALSNLEQYSEAISSFDKALTFALDNEGILVEKAKMLCAIGRFEEAIECSNSVLQNDSRLPDLRRTKAQARFIKAEALMSMGDLKGALKCVRETTELLPGDPVAWSNYGAFLSRAGNPDQALECFDRAIEIDPGRAEYWWNRAEVMAVLDDLEGSVRDLEQASRQDPENALFHFVKAERLEKMGKWQEALDSYVRAGQLGHPNAEGSWSRLRQLISSGSEPSEEASWVRVSGSSPPSQRPASPTERVAEADGFEAIARDPDRDPNADSAQEVWLNPEAIRGLYDRGFNLVTSSLPAFTHTSQEPLLQRLCAVKLFRKDNVIWIALEGDQIISLESRNYAVALMTVLPIDHPLRQSQPSIFAVNRFGEWPLLSIQPVPISEIWAGICLIKSLYNLYSYDPNVDRLEDALDTHLAEEVRAYLVEIEAINRYTNGRFCDAISQLVERAGLIDTRQVIRLVTSPENVAGLVQPLHGVVSDEVPQSPDEIAIRLGTFSIAILFHVIDNAAGSEQQKFHQLQQGLLDLIRTNRDQAERLPKS